MGKKQIGVRVMPQLYEVLDAAAKQDARTVSALAELLIVESLQRRGLLPADFQPLDLRSVRYQRTNDQTDP